MRLPYLDFVNLWRERVRRFIERGRSATWGDLSTRREQAQASLLRKLTRRPLDQEGDGDMGWIDKIQKAIEDTITLDVVTATGKIELKRPDPEEGAIEAGAAEAGNLAAAAAGGVAGAAPQEHGFERIAAEVSYLVQNTQLEVVAFTHSEWDCDTFAFVKSDLTPSEAKLVETHAATVAAAHDTRRKAVQMLKSVL